MSTAKEHGDKRHAFEKWLMAAAPGRFHEESFDIDRHGDYYENAETHLFWTVWEAGCASARSHVAPNCPYRSYKDHDPANCGHCSSPSTTRQSSETPRMDAVSVAMFAHFKTSAMTVQDIEDFLAEGRKLERELAVSFKRFDDLQAHYSNELTKLEGASAASAIGEPVAEVVEIKDTMDSYTQRPPKSRSIVPYKPIDQLQVGTKLYTHPPTTGRSEIVEECAKVADYMHENGLNTSADQALLDCAHGIRALKNRADGGKQT